MKLKRIILLLSAQLICILGETTENPDTTTLGSEVTEKPSALPAATETTTGGTDASGVVESVGTTTAAIPDAAATSDAAVTPDATASQTDSPTAGHTPSTQTDTTNSTDFGDFDLFITEEMKKVLEKYNLDPQSLKELFSAGITSDNGSVTVVGDGNERVTLTFKETDKESTQSNQDTSGTGSNQNLIQIVQAFIKQVETGDSEKKPEELEILRQQMALLTTTPDAQDAPDGGPQARRNTMRTASTGASLPIGTALPASSSNALSMRQYNIYKYIMNKLRESIRESRMLEQQFNRGQINQQSYNLRRESMRNARRQLFQIEAILVKRYPSLPGIYAYEQSARRLPSRPFVPGIGSSALSRFGDFQQFRQRLRNQVATSSIPASDRFLTGTVTGTNAHVDSLNSIGLTQIANAPDLSGRIPTSPQPSTLEILRDVEGTVRVEQTGDPDFVINRLVWDNYYDGTSQGSTIGRTSGSATSGMLPASPFRNNRFSSRFQGFRRFPPGGVMGPRFIPQARPFVGPPPRMVF